MTEININRSLQKLIEELTENLDWDGMRKLIIPLLEEFIEKKDDETAYKIYEVHTRLNHINLWQDVIKSAPVPPIDVKKGIQSLEIGIYYVQNIDWNGSLTKEIILKKMTEAIELMKGGGK